MELKTTNVQQIEEVNYGVYLWKMPDGSFVADDEQHFLMIRAIKGDPVRIQKMKDAVRSFGITEGSAYFMSGHRPVTDEEYEEQKQRLDWGLVPDPQDIPAHLEAKRHERRLRGN